MPNIALELAPPNVLAIAYVPSRFRPAFALLLQIDNRFEGLLRAAREPMIAQIKLAWWREAFANPPHLRPKGEPLLQALNEAGDLIPNTALEALVLGWEILLGSEEWSQDILDKHADLRAEAVFQTYARWINSAQELQPVGRMWALGALQIAFPERVPGDIVAPRAVLPKARTLRPLSILAMSVRTMSGPRLVWHALTGR